MCASLIRNINGKFMQRIQLFLIVVMVISRLVGGATALEGRVEVCLNSVWGAVCHHYFHFEEAQVVCSQLGFQRAGKL